MSESISPKHTFVPATGWDFLLPWYDSLASFFTKESVSKQSLAELIDLKHGSQIVDLGCGTGTLLFKIEDRVRALGKLKVELTGLEIDPRQIEKAEQKHRQRLATMRAPDRAERQIRFSASSILDVTLPDACCDTVICSLVFHHLTAAQKQAALAEMHRILRPSGQMLLMDFGRPLGKIARLGFIAVRILDGFATTEDNMQGNLPKLMSEAGFGRIQESFRMETLLGTIYCWKTEVSPAHGGN